MTADLDEKELAVGAAAAFQHPEEVAALAAFLVSDEAAYITGEVINISGGLYTERRPHAPFSFSAHLSSLFSLMQTQRVVVTGIGIWSCRHRCANPVTASLRAGRSGVGVDPERAAYGYQSTLTGIVERPVLKGLARPPHAHRPGRGGEYAYMAARQALQMAQLGDEQLREREVGCIFGNDSSAAPIIRPQKSCAKHDSALLGSGFSSSVQQIRPSR